jgi:hypothetical protein
LARWLRPTNPVSNKAFLLTRRADFPPDNGHYRDSTLASLARMESGSPTFPSTVLSADGSLIDQSPIDPNTTSGSLYGLNLNQEVWRWRFCGCEPVHGVGRPSKRQILHSRGSADAGGRPRRRMFGLRPRRSRILSASADFSCAWSVSEVPADASPSKQSVTQSAERHIV